MRAMARHRSHSIEFKRRVAQEFIAGETLHALAKRHDVSRTLIRVWVKKLEAGALDEDAEAADLLQGYEAKIAEVASRHYLNAEKRPKLNRSPVSLVSAGVEPAVSKEMRGGKYDVSP
jgi:transposase-like protein